MSTIISGKAEIRALNVRKQGPDDDKVLAIDVKLCDCRCGPGLLKRLLGAADEAGVCLSFWDVDSELRYPGLDPIGSWAEITNCDVRLEGLELTGATVRKFKVRLAGEFVGYADFQLTVVDPPARAVSHVADLVAQEVRVHVEKAQGELSLEPQEGAA